MNYTNVLSDVAQVAVECHRNPSDITVIAVSKGYLWEQAHLVYQQGCRNFGENRIPEFLEKADLAPHDIVWHFIGTLQKNKVRKAIGRFGLIHSVDMPELAEKISQCSQEVGIKISVLLQVNTSGELSKHGLTAKEWKTHLDKVIALPGLSVEGLMTMAPLTNDDELIRNCFRQLRILRDELGKPFKHLSMGMSHDYRIAIEEGATLLRIGTAIFT